MNAPISRARPWASLMATYETTPAATPAVMEYVNGMITTVRKTGIAVARSDQSTCRAFIIIMAPMTTSAAAATSPGTIAVGRPTYAHMLCLARHVDTEPKRPGPDVLADAGPMSWSRATGEAAIRLACRFLRDETATRFVVDPFCGEGSVLAVANAYGFAATGVDLSAKRCRAALRQQCVMTT